MMNDDLGIHDPDGRVITFPVHPGGGPCFTYIFGNFFNNLEIRFNCDTRRIIDIESVHIEQIYEIPFLRRPGYWDMPEGLFRSRGAFFFNEYPDHLTWTMFLFNLVGRELDILIGEPEDPEEFYEHGRIQFYYNKDMDLIYIKIVDLTDEEVAHFQSYVRDQ